MFIMRILRDIRAVSWNGCDMPFDFIYYMQRTMLLEGNDYWLISQIYFVISDKVHDKNISTT